jgi:hypothetical protein
MAFDELLALLQPSSEPHGRCDPSDWENIEARLGTPLPTDFKQFMERYGGCSLWDWMQILSPTGIPSPLEKQHSLVARFLPRLQSKFAAFPSPGGLLLFASDENANHYFWKTGDSADRWPIVLLSEDLQDHFHFAGSFTSFICWLVTTPELPEIISSIPFRSRPGPVLRPS